MQPAQATIPGAVNIFFNEYTVHYYSQSSSLWEAAYINCFASNVTHGPTHVGIMIFTHPNGSKPPGLEHPAGILPTDIPNTQMNHLELRNGIQFFIIYYQLDRFDDVINQLRYGVDRVPADNTGDNLSMFVSADPRAHVWALCNNLHVPVGAQYHI